MEKVHVQACKLLLNVPTYTPNDMVLGDLGRFPLLVNSAARSLGHSAGVYKLVRALFPQRHPAQAPELRTIQQRRNYLRVEEFLVSTYEATTEQSRKAYEMLYGMQERDCASRTWVAQIKFILCYKGFGYVWMCGCVGS